MESQPKMMTRENNTVKMDKAEWFKGSLATWLLVVLIPAGGFAAKRFIDDNLNFHQMTTSYRQSDLERITRLEEQVVGLKENLKQINEGQRRVESELRLLNDWLRNKP